MLRAYTNSPHTRVRKMLASTVQFSTYNQTPPIRPRRTREPPQGTRRYEKQEGPDTKQRLPAPSGPNSVPTTSHPIPTTFPARPRTGRTSGDYQAPAELVSVPPSSTTPHARRHPDTGTDHGVGAALHHPNASGGECSLERR